MTSQTRLARTAGFLHLGQSRRRAAAVNIPSNRTCRPSLTRRAPAHHPRRRNPATNHKINNLFTQTP